MLDRFTPDLARVLDRATEEAQIFGHCTVGLEHLLLALAFDHQSYPSKMLQAKGLNYHILCQRVARVLGRGQDHDQKPPLAAEIYLFLLLVIEVARWPEPQAIPVKIVFDLLMEEPTVIGPILGAIGKPMVKFWGGLQAGVCEESDSILYRQMLNCHIPMAGGDFSAAANFALLFARVEAATFNFARRRIHSDSILIGLVAEQSGEAGKLLRKMGVTIRRIRGKEYDSVARELQSSDLKPLNFSDEARSILHSARKFCRSQNQPFVTSLHLLWAIVFSGASEARDLLAALIGDLAVLKLDLQKIFRSSSHEGTINEIELNFRLFAIIQAGGIGDRTNKMASAGIDTRAEEALGEWLPPASTENVFDLSLLDQASVDVMLAAYREYAKLRFVNFDSKHVLLGILAHGQTPAVHTLAHWGVDLNLARGEVARLESLGLVCEPGKKLTFDVAALLSEALLLARQSGADKVSPGHMLWAMAKSVDPQILVLIERLGLNPALFCHHASGPDESKLRTHASIYGDVITILPAGLEIFGMLCQPSVASAVQTALDEAMPCRITEVGGEFLLLGLLSAPGLAAKVLQDLGVCGDTSRGIIKKMSGVSDVASDDTEQKTVVDPRSEEQFVNVLDQSVQLRKLQMRLKLQSGQTALPLSILSPGKFLPFIRLVERLTIDEHLAPVIVYWSREAVLRLLPPGREYGNLVRESAFVGCFSENKLTPPDQWCLFIESRRLCLVLFGQQVPGVEKYQCSGSMDPAIVGDSFDRLLPVLQSLNLEDSKKVEECRASLRRTGSEPGIVQVLKWAWPAAKTQSLLGGVIAPGVSEQQAVFDAGVEKAFKKALEVSLQSGKVLVGSEHLLMGLIESKNVRFLDLLNRLQISPSTVLDRLQDCMTLYFNQ